MRDINRIILSRNSFRPIKKNIKVKINIGFDTETQDGKCFLIGYYTKDRREIKHVEDFKDCLDFLYNRFFTGTNNFFYNLKYDYQAILKHLDIEYLRELARYDQVIYDDYIIKIIPKKCFIITKNNISVKFYDLAQFYNFMKLDTAGERFLNINKIKLDDRDIDIKDLSSDEYLHDLEYRHILDQYLYQDCKITYLLANKLNDLVRPYLIPKSFYSQASFSQQYFLENLKRRLNLPSNHILDFSLKNYHGGRFEVIKKGTFDKAYFQDIKSAYPYHNMNIPDISKGIWKRDKEYRSDSLISLYKINTQIYDIDISPLRVKHKGLIKYPIGVYKDTYINKKEIEILNDLGYRYEILDAYHYYDKEPEYIYSWLKHFYDLKERMKKDGMKEESMIPKILINGFYGKLIQVTDSYILSEDKIKNKMYDWHGFLDHGDNLTHIYRAYKGGLLFNPVIANEITANTRCQLFNSVKGVHDKVIGFQTDSIISDSKLSLDYGENIGQWEQENSGRTVILGSGIYEVEDQKTRVRGFDKNFSLFDNLDKYGDLGYIPIDNRVNMQLKSTMRLKISDPHKMELFNLIMDINKELNINMDTKRLWDRDFNNCRDALESRIYSKPLVL